MIESDASVVHVATGGLFLGAFIPRINICVWHPYTTLSLTLCLDALKRVLMILYLRVTKVVLDAFIQTGLVVHALAQVRNRPVHAHCQW